MARCDGPDRQAPEEPGPPPSVETGNPRGDRVLDQSEVARTRSHAAIARSGAARRLAKVARDQAEAVRARARIPEQLPGPTEGPSDHERRGGPDHRSRLSTDLLQRRRELAGIAERLAAEADTFATILEQSAERGDSERREELARVERQVAEIGRRNAERLRSPQWGNLQLESYPSLPGHGADTPPDDPAPHDAGRPVSRTTAPGPAARDGAGGPPRLTSG